MKVKLSDSVIQRAAPKAKPYQLHDPCGLVVRVQPSGVKSYQVQWARGKTLTLGRVGILTLERAKTKAREALVEAQEHGQPKAAAEQQAKSGTLGEFIDETFAPWVLEHQRDGKGALQALKAQFGDYWNKPMTDITPWVLEKYRSSRLKAGIAPATVNRHLTRLRTAFTKARMWKLIEHLPFADIRPLKTDKAGVVRYLHPDEDSRLRKALADRDITTRAERRNANRWRAERGYPLYPELPVHGFGDHLTPMVLVSLNTGVRRGELFSLRWADINLQTKTLTIHGHSAKSGSTRHVPLNAEALAALKMWRAQSEDTTGLVFPSREGERLNNVKKSWARLLQLAGIENFRWHDMRHHFASRLVMAGVDLNTVRELLGHADIKMTLRYAHLAPEHKAAAVAKLVR